jgi:hypothetical protein
MYEVELEDYERWSNIPYGGRVTAYVSGNVELDTLSLQEADQEVILSKRQALELADLIHRHFGYGTDSYSGGSVTRIERSQKQQEQNASYNSQVGR